MISNVKYFTQNKHLVNVKIFLPLHINLVVFAVNTFGTKIYFLKQILKWFSEKFLLKA